MTAENTTTTPPIAGAQLAAALVIAQAAAVAVEKDGRNAHHGYDYASAEAIIRAASPALCSAGLSLGVVSVGPVELLNKLWLRRVFLLAHTSGEQREIVQLWPIVESKGKPMDKAIAGADTAGLSYLLRTLLLMPRVERGTEMDEWAKDADRWLEGLAREASVTPHALAAFLGGRGKPYREISLEKRDTARAWLLDEATLSALKSSAAKGSK